MPNNVKFEIDLDTIIWLWWIDMLWMLLVFDIWYIHTKSQEYCATERLV